MNHGHDTQSWWASLNHGGLLLAPSKLAALFPDPAAPLSYALADRLRRDLTRLREGSDDRLAGFLDTVLEEVLGLSRARWTKGNEVAREWSRALVTREVLRPRRLWLGPNGAVLPVFVADGTRGGPREEPVRLGVGRGKREVARVVEWLRSAAQDPALRRDGRDVPRLALLATHRQLRLIHAGTDYDAFCEWDTALWFQEGEPGPQVAALRALLSAEALAPKAPGQASPLVAAIQASRQGQAELSSALGERVRQAVELLIQESGAALERVDGGATGDAERASRKSIYLAATRVVMRCVVILFAEARELLPRSNAIYEASYGLQGLRAELDRAGGGRAAERLRFSRGAWPRLLSLFHLVYHGSPHEALPVPRYGGGLFLPGDAASSEPVLRALAAFEHPDNAPTDLAVHRMLELLCRSRVRVRQGRNSRWVEAPVDFSDLSSEYIGILYEGLLDFELRRAPEGDAMVFLNLGDQPVLPLSRLDGMSNDDLARLLEKLRTSTDRVEGDDEDASDTVEARDPTEDDVEAEAGASAAEATDAEEADVDDARVLREAVQIWAERAVKAARLVRYPRNDADPRVRERWNEEVAAAGRGLVARLVLPGAWFLVRWGGTRKGSGTFYTRPQLAGPIVRRALQPLAYEAVTETTDEATGLRTVTAWAPRTPEAILALKVCDPAMGSGSFLVSALRYLTEALVASLHHHDRLHSNTEQTLCRLADGQPHDHPSQETLPLPETHPEFDERLRARLKRHVVERCLYGVDLDPLAVELARTSLWVETMDYRLPFGFVDHKLKCGNSLVGCWFDRFQDYPALAWEREGGDKGHTGFVHHYREVRAARGGAVKRSGDKWTAAIKERRDSVVLPALRSWLEERDPSQRTLWATDGKGAEALHQKGLAVFERLHALPVHEVEERERVYREELAGSAALGQLKGAFDTWCALWFWPGEELESAPGPKELLAPGAAARAVVERVAGALRFFHWELEFPDVFAGRATGFSAIVGNPPWGTQKPSSMEFFSNLDPLYRTYGKQEALKRQGELFAASPAVEVDWLSYSAGFKALSNWTKNAAYPFGAPEELGTPVSLGRGAEGERLRSRWAELRAGRRGYADPEHPFQHQGSADINTYKMFLELGHAVLGSGGCLGLLIPSGLYTDNGSRALRELFLRRCAWTHLYAFQNERFVFEGIDHRFKMAVVHVHKGGLTEVLRTRFRIGPGDSPEAHEVEEDLTDEAGYLPLPPERIQRFSPKTGSILEVRTARDLAVLEKLYANGVLLGDDGPQGWGIRYTREFDMTNDSKLFPPRPQWEAKGYRADEYGHWLKGPWRAYDGPQSILERAEGLVLSVDGTQAIEAGGIEDVALPLYQGIMVQQFDFAPKGWRSGTGLRAVWEELPWDAKRIEPQFLLSPRLSGWSTPQTLRLGFRDIARNTDARTLIAATLPAVPCGNKVPLLASREGDRGTLTLTANLNSFAFDWVQRARQGATSLNYYILEEQPLLTRPARPLTTIAAVSLRLGTSNPSFASAWVPGQDNQRPWRRLWAITPHERLRLRCILDAAVAALYGLDVHDFGWILRDCDHPRDRVCNQPFSRTLDPKGFWRVDKDQDPELRHTVLSLVAFHELKKLGLEAFLALNDGDGWALPERLRLTDYGLGHDERAREAQPVAARLGERFLPWQLEQGVEESWEECRRHAELIERIVPRGERGEDSPRGAAEVRTAGGENREEERRAGIGGGFATTTTGQGLLFAAETTTRRRRTR